MDAGKRVTTMSDAGEAGAGPFGSACAPWPPTSSVGSSVLPPGVLVDCGLVELGVLVDGPDPASAPVCAPF